MDMQVVSVLSATAVLQEAHLELQQNKCSQNKLERDLTDILKSKKIIHSPLDKLIQKELKHLLDNKSIIIKPADKNLGLVVMNVEQYTSMCYKHLNDAKTYSKLAPNSYLRLLENHTLREKPHNFCNSHHI